MKYILALFALALAASPISLCAAAVQTTAFTYQGSLSVSGQPANGNFDLTFALFNAETSGTQVGSTISAPQFPVAQGLFTIDLDFPGAFTGNQSWLEVTVNGTPVTPRQAINAAPVAQYALTGSTSGQDVSEVYGTSPLVVTTATTTYTLIPGLTATINVPDNAVVHVHTDGGAQSTGASSSTYSVADIGLFVDEVVTNSGGQRRLAIANTAALAQLIGNWSIDHTYTLPPGNHTFEVKAVSGAGGSSTLNVSSGSAPQLQGVLTVMIINK